MGNSPRRIKHQVQKAVKKAQTEGYEKEKGEADEKLKKIYLASPEKVKKLKGKAASKHKHHQTTPGIEVTYQTEPNSIHLEGLSWPQTTQKQNLEGASRLQRKLEKTKPRPGKNQKNR